MKKVLTQLKEGSRFKFGGIWFIAGQFHEDGDTVSCQIENKQAYVQISKAAGVKVANLYPKSPLYAKVKYSVVVRLVNIERAMEIIERCGAEMARSKRVISQQYKSGHLKFIATVEQAYNISKLLNEIEEEASNAGYTFE